MFTLSFHNLVELVRALSHGNPFELRVYMNCSSPVLNFCLVFLLQELRILFGVLQLFWLPRAASSLGGDLRLLIFLLKGPVPLLLQLPLPLPPLPLLGLLLLHCPLRHDASLCVLDSQVDVVGDAVLDPVLVLLLDNQVPVVHHRHWLEQVR